MGTCRQCPETQCSVNNNNNNNNPRLVWTQRACVLLWPEIVRPVGEKERERLDAGCCRRDDDHLIQLFYVNDH